MNETMNETMNLCKILKGHEGETFYCTIFGEVKLHCINSNNIGYPIEIIIEDEVIHVLDECGKFVKDYEEGECTLFPSKNQRDWNKWVEEQKPKVKVPKTWSELCEAGKAIRNIAQIDSEFGHFSDTVGKSAIEKSALALLKTHQLIEYSYGGVPSVKERLIVLGNPTYDIDIDDEGNFLVGETGLPTSLIAFHTKKQAEEFLSKPENVQLLKDYFMI